MSDALELPEAIGQNAALRHASVEELARTLDKTGASEAFKAAVASGDTSPLSKEPGQQPMHATHVSQGPGHEDDEDDSERPSRPEPDQPCRPK